jgi:hypothetical protein
MSLKSGDGVAYGISLAFWENGVLLGVLALFNLTVVYAILSTDSSVSQSVYAALTNSQPSDFLPQSALLPSVLLGTLERLSSILAHAAWGTLCVLSALTRRRRYLCYALPMGLIDAAVPFASLNLSLFEAGVFLFSVWFSVVAWRSFKQAEQSANHSDGRPGGTTS